MSTQKKEFLDKLFELCREYQGEISTCKMLKMFRNYTDRLDA